MMKKVITGYVSEFSSNVDHSYITIYNGEDDKFIEFKDCDIYLPLHTKVKITIEQIDTNPD